MKKLMFALVVLAASSSFAAKKQSVVEKPKSLARTMSKSSARAAAPAQATASVPAARPENPTVILACGRKVPASMLDKTAAPAPAALASSAPAAGVQARTGQVR